MDAEAVAPSTLRVRDHDCQEDDGSVSVKELVEAFRVLGELQDIINEVDVDCRRPIDFHMFFNQNGQEDDGFDTEKGLDEAFKVAPSREQAAAHDKESGCEVHLEFLRREAVFLRRIAVCFGLRPVGRRVPVAPTLGVLLPGVGPPAVVPTHPQTFGTYTSV